MKQVSPERRTSLSVDRRGALVLGSLGVLGLAAAAFQDRVDDCLHGVTRGNAYLDTFPRSLPGASRVDTMRMVRARHCLVHVRQAHDTLQNTAEQDRTVRAIQSDVTRIVGSLMDHPKVRLPRVYLENMRTPAQIETEATAAVVPPLAPEQADVLLEGNLRVTEELRAELKKSGLSRERREQCLTFLRQLERSRRDLALQRINPEALRRERQDDIHAMNASFRLRAERGLEVVPAEHPDAADEAYRLVREHAAPGFTEIPPEARDAVFRLRELGLLRLVADADETGAVTVYGGGHDFRRPIREWNLDHPEHAFSLAEITPDAYARLIEGKH